MASAAVLDPPGAPSSDGADGDIGDLAAWAGLAGNVLARLYRAFLLTLLVAAIVPALGSWSSLVVRTGSMEPAIEAGDVVVAQPFSASERVPLGRVVVFPNPAKPGEDELLVHRIVENLGGGEFATAGDANASYDAQPVTAEDVRSRATLLVPWVGRPLLWLSDGRPLPLAAWTLVTALAFVLAARRPRGSRTGGSSGPSDGSPGRRRRLTRSRRVRSGPAPALALLAATGLALAVTPTASAGFTDRTVSPANSWTVSPTLAHRLALASPGQVVRGSVPLAATLSNTGTSDGYAVTMQYAVPGTSGWTAICSKSSAPYSCSWATAGVANGTYDLRAVATSGTNTVTSPVVRGVLVDNAAPSVTMQDPGTPLRGVRTFTATATDAHSGVQRVVIQHALSGSTTWKDLCSLTTSPYSCQVDTTTLANGTHSLRAVATDVAGSSATSPVVGNRVVDNVVTTVAVNDPGAILVGTVAVSATASSTAGVASVRIQGAPAGSDSWGDVCLDTTSPYSCSFNTTTVPDGLYDLRAIVTDRLGQTTTSAVVADRRVDNTAPRALDVQTTNGGVLGRLDPGDTMSLTYSELMRTDSISPGWDGSPVAVNLRLRDGLFLGTGSSGDLVDVLRGGSTVNLGTVNLREDYIFFLGNAQFAATMASTTVTVNGVEVTRVTITVGAQVSGITPRTVTAASTMSWEPSWRATDLGGLDTDPAVAFESGGSDRQF